MNEEIDKIMPKSKRQESNYSFGIAPPEGQSLLSRNNSLMPEPPSIKKSKNGNHYTNVRV
jgi:hypothetical protein